MKGIHFVGYHSYDDFQLLLTKKEMGAPEVKESTTDIPGADGVIDNTDFFGEPKYSNVVHRFDFETVVPQSEFLSLFSTIKNAIHGKKGRIILDDDPSFFYVGRCKVSKFTNERNIGQISVECDCEPYKHKVSKTVVTLAVDGFRAITLTNSRKRAVPEITTTAAMTIAFGSGSWSVSAGTFTIPELELAEGDNLVTVTGAGDISFQWREGSL